MDNVLTFPDRATGFVPQRLVEARLARQMSRAELGREIGMTGTAVGNYETGTRRPDMNALLSIAEKLDQSVAFFLRASPSIEGRQGARFFRSVGPKSNKLNQAFEVKSKWLWELVSFLTEFVRLPGLSVYEADGCDAYSRQEIEEIAQAARRFWGLGDGPIANMVALLETHGIVVTRFETQTKCVDAFSSWIDDRPYVFLASDKSSACRSRFDAAHELGHLILHRGVAQEDVEDKRTRDRIEREANLFAGAFLLPEGTFLAEFYSARMEHLKGLKRRWRVSMAALAHRAKEIGAIDDDQYIQFRKQLSHHKWLTREPLDDEIAIEEPKLLLKAWRLLIDNGVIRDSAFEDKIGFSPEMVKRLSGMAPTGSREENEASVAMRF